MDPGEARDILGVGPDATLAAVRAAYRRMVRMHHPDLASDVSSTATTVRINQAYAVLRAPVVAATDPTDITPITDDPLVGSPLRVSSEEGDSLRVDAPVDEAFFRLLEAAYTLGDVTHVDFDDGLLETLVWTDDGRVCSLVISFQAIDAVSTEALITLQPLDSGSCPASGSITEFIAAAVRG